jgi:hypothetical protein
MSKTELHRAAEQLRRRAEAASAGPWHIQNGHAHNVHTFPGGKPVADFIGSEDAHYIALMHPAVGLAIADWLDSWRDDSTNELDGNEDWTHAMAIARALLGESAGPVADV